MTAADSSARFRVGEWLVEPGLDRLTRDGDIATVEPRVMAVLVHLARRAGEVVSADELVDAVWHGGAVGPGSIYQNIAQLRKVLGDDAENPRYITTIPRKGYRLIAPVMVIPAEAANAVPGAEWVAGEPHSFWKELRRRKVLRVSLAYLAVAWLIVQAFSVIAPHAGLPHGSTELLVVLAVLGFPIAAVMAWTLEITPDGVVVDKPVLGGHHGLNVLTAAAILLAAGIVAYQWVSTPAPEAGRVSIAVLPFMDLSEGGENEYFCDGLSEELLNGLAKIPDLHVAARTSSFAFKDKQENVAEIGRQLQVNHLLEGSVRKSGNRVKITAQLIDVASGYHRWSETYERPLDDIFSIQEEISRAVVDALKIRLAGESNALLAQRHTENIDAYDLYLLGRHHWHQRTSQSLNQAKAYFQQAIDIDPEFALAYTGLADSQIALHYYGNLSLQEATTRALPYVVQALKLDDRLAEAHASLGLLRKDHFDYAAADMSLQQAIALNPNYALAHVWYGISLHSQGELQRAMVSYQRAVELDPLSFFVNIRIALTLLLMGRFDDSLAYYHRGIELAPEHPNSYWGIGLLELERGRLDEAIPWFEQAIALDPQRTEFLLQLGWIYMDLGDFETAERIFDRVIELAPDDDDRKLPKGWWLIARGEYDRLLEFARERMLVPPNDAGILAYGGFYEMLAGNYDRALTYYQEGIEQASIGVEILYNYWDLHWGTIHSVWLARAYLQTGQTADGAAMLEETLARIEQRREKGAVEHGSYYIQASAHALQGKTTEALAALEKAIELGWRRAWWAERDPTLASIREEPRFEQLMDEVREDVAAMRLRLAQSTVD